MRVIVAASVGQRLARCHEFRPEAHDDPLESYRQRWAIELCFACLKTKGFDIESTHLRHAERLEKMFAIASMAAAALAASKNQNKIQTGSRKNPRRKKTTATPLAPPSSVA